MSELARSNEGVEVDTSPPQTMATWPRELNKAVTDCGWVYQVALRDGTVIEFDGASISDDEGEWVLLHRPRVLAGQTLTSGPARSMSVRVADIVSVVDGDS